MHAQPAAPSAPWPDLRRSVFLPLVAIVLLLLLALGLAVLWNEWHTETKRLNREFDAAVRLFGLRLAGDIETMQVAMEPLREDPAILERFMAGDRDGLRQLVDARFDALHTDHGISHMYFVGADRVTLLRVHQPERHGDVIDRFSMREAQRTGAPTHGLELGPLGTLTLRVVVPLRHGDRVIGFFEVGREVEHYAEDIRRTLDTDLRVLIRKDLLVEQTWTEGQAMLGREPDWDRFDAFVATGSAEAGEDIGAAFDEVVPSISQAELEPARIQLPDGRRLALGARPLLDASQRDVGVLLISLDVSESVFAFRRTLLGFLIAFTIFGTVMVALLHRIIRRADRSLRAAESIAAGAKAELQQAVQERTAQLERQIAEHSETEAQLRQAQKMEVIGQLTGGVAHDFNNLLAIIMSDLEYLRERLADEGLGDEIDELLAGAWEATERGAALVERLLAVSRKQPLSPRAVDANRVILGLMPLLERAVPRSVELVTELVPQPWLCFVDPAQLENLILNLAINARDAMPDGGSLTIKSTNRRVEPDAANKWGIAPGDYVKLTVRDTGMGMPAEVLARAFDPFFTTKEIGKGSGLGLSMVHGTAKQSGGHVELDSTVGQGTTVRLLLPRAHTAVSDHVEGALV